MGCRGCGGVRTSSGAGPGAALFAGLTALPKTTALTSYSYRLSHAKQAAFLTALDKATLNTGLATGQAVHLDLHAKAWTAMTIARAGGKRPAESKSSTTPPPP